MRAFSDICYMLADVWSFHNTNTRTRAPLGLLAYYHKKRNSPLRATMQDEMRHIMRDMLPNLQTALSAGFLFSIQHLYEDQVNQPTSSFHG